MKFKELPLRVLLLSCLLYLAFCTNCQSDQYTVEKKNGEIECQNCGECNPSYGRNPPCGSHVYYPVVTECKPCIKGTFSDKDDGADCKQCHHCVKYEKVLMQCTNKSDTKCSGKCETGYYFTKGAPRTCQKCSYCCHDGKDEEQTECITHGLNATNQHCSVRVDKQCGPTTIPPSGTQASDEGGSNTTLPIVLGVVGVIALIVIVLVITLLWVQHRKKNSRRSAGHEGESNNSQVVEWQQTALGASPDGQQLPPSKQAAPSKGYVNLHCNASNPGTPQLSSVKQTDYDDGENNQPTTPGTNGSAKIKRQISKDSQRSKALGSSPDGQQLPPSKQAAPSKGFVNLHCNASNPGTPQLSSVEPMDYDDGENNQPSTPGINGGAKIERQISKDSQSSKGENGYAPRKRRSSSIIGSLEEKAKKMSLKKEDSLLSDDEDEESKVPVPKIKEHPQSQTVQQGNRIEFTCTVKGKKTVFYQWLKDDVELEGQHNFSLVLKSVKMTDFGSYMCRVKYEHSESVESYAAELNVEPGVGKEYKLLKNLDLDTQGRISVLLSSKKYGVGGYSLVAERYGMEKIEIDGLVQSHQPGKDVIQYLGASYPGLTVYHFCKDLKNKRMKRLDIVRELESHFVVAKANSALNPSA